MAHDKATAMAAVSPGGETARGLIGTGAPLSDITKIAVLRANRLGDFVVALPALTALRAAYPAAEIVLLGLAWHAAFLAGRPQPINRVVVIPPYPGVGEAEDTRRRPRRARRLLRLAGGGGLRSGAATPRRRAVLQSLHPAGRARLTAGLWTPDAAPLDRWIPYLPYQHEVLRFLEVVGLVGGGPVPLTPQLTVTADDLAEARRALPDDGRPLVAIHPRRSTIPVAAGRQHISPRSATPWPSPGRAWPWSGRRKEARSPPSWARSPSAA